MGKRIRLSGNLTLDGKAPSPSATIEVYRSVCNNWRSGTDRLPDVTTDNRGDFRITDTPTEGGRITYTARWAGNDTYADATASHEVAVSSTAAAVTATIQQPAYATEPFWLAGGVSYQVGDCTGLKTISVTRQVGAGVVTQLPTLTTGIDCSYRFQDAPATPADVRYTFSWAGDATHQAASTTVVGPCRSSRPMSRQLPRTTT